MLRLRLNYLHPCARKPRFWATAAAIVLAMVAGAEGILWFGQHFFRLTFDRQVDPCLPWRLSIVTPYDGRAPEKGRIVAFRSSRVPWLGEAAKVVMGTSGDRVTVRNKDLFLNGHKLTHLNICDKSTHPTYCADRDYVIATGELLLLTPHPNSFDGRYWGTVHQSEITGYVVPFRSLWGGLPARYSPDTLFAA